MLPPLCFIRFSRNNCARTAVELEQNLEQGTFSTPEALTYFPEPEEFRLGPEEYLKHIAHAKEGGGHPDHRQPERLFPGGWTAYAKAIQTPGPMRWS